MNHCELCRKDGHIAFECDSDRATTVDEAVNHWFSIIINQYQWNFAKTVHKELFIEAHHMRRLSNGDFIYLLRGFIDPKNWIEFAKMYTRDQYMYFYLGYKSREFIGSPEYERLNEASKKRIRVDAQYWFNRLYFGQTRANELWYIDLEEPNTINDRTNVNSECAVCLCDNLMRGETSVFSCGHEFCAGCSRTMIMTMRPLKCPLCRAHITRIIHYQNDGNFSLQTI